MPFIAIVHIPDHTPIASALDPEEIGIHLDLDLRPSGAKVVGLYNFPNKSELTCTGNCVRKGSGAWTRDKSGFMKCAICGSRNKKIRRWFAGGLFDWFGANIYPHAPALFRTPEGYVLPPRT